MKRKIVITGMYLFVLLSAQQQKKFGGR